MAENGKHFGGRKKKTSSIFIKKDVYFKHEVHFDVSLMCVYEYYNTKKIIVIPDAIALLQYLKRRFGKIEIDTVIRMTKKKSIDVHHWCVCIVHLSFT